MSSRKVKFPVTNWRPVPGSSDHDDHCKKQRSTEVDQARQFFRKPQSSEERKARLKKLKQKLPRARCGIT